MYIKKKKLLNLIKSYRNKFVSQYNTYKFIKVFRYKIRLN